MENNQDWDPEQARLQYSRCLQAGATFAQTLNLGHAGPNGPFYEGVREAVEEMVITGDLTDLEEVEKLVKFSLGPTEQQLWAVKLQRGGLAGYCLAYGYFFGFPVPGLHLDPIAAALRWHPHLQHRSDSNQPEERH